jgi:hypothetical protein
MAFSIMTSLLGMVITLALAFGFDKWLFIQERYARQNGNLASVLIWTIFEGLLLGVVWVAFSWVILVKSRRNRPVSTVLVVIGLMTFSWYQLQYLFPDWPKQLFLLQPRPINLQYTGIFMTTLGLLNILLPNHNSQ